MRERNYYLFRKALAGRQ